MDGRMAKDSVSKKKFGAILYIEKIPRHTTDHKYYKMTLFFWPNLFIYFYSLKADVLGGKEAHI